MDRHDVAEISQEGSVNAPDQPETIPFSYGALYSRVRNNSLQVTLLCMHLRFALPHTSKPPYPYTSTSNLHLWKFNSHHLHHMLLPDSEFLTRNDDFSAELNEHFPDDFEKLRSRNGVELEDLAKSFCPIRNAARMEEHSGNKGGRSSAFIYFTYNRHFILKTLKHSEVRFVQKIREDMMNFLLGDEGKTSFLAKILGVFSLRMQGMEGIHFVIMENVMPFTASLDLLFDLKGSQVHRAVLPPDHPIDLNIKGKVLKDMDFLRVKSEVKLTPDSYTYFHNQITKDTNFLRSIRSMDYSLLLGLASGSEGVLPSRALKEASSEAVWCVGVIDYLQEYNVGKHLERVSKLIVSPTDNPDAHSCVNPDFYQERFCAFLRSVLS